MPFYLHKSSVDKFCILLLEEEISYVIHTVFLSFWIPLMSDKMGLFKHLHTLRWEALLQLMICMLDMAVQCQSLLTSCLMSRKIHQAVQDSNLFHASIMGDQLFGVVNGIISRCSPLNPVFLGVHFLQEIVHSIMVCHGVLPFRLTCHFLLFLFSIDVKKSSFSIVFNIILVSAKLAVLHSFYGQQD